MEREVDVLAVSGLAEDIRDVILEYQAIQVLLLRKCRSTWMGVRRRFPLNRTFSWNDLLVDCAPTHSFVCIFRMT